MSPLTNKEVGERIRAFRQERGLSAEVVAEKMGMSKSNFTKYERGVAKRIDREFLLKVANILNVDVTEINGLSDILPSAHKPVDNKLSDDQKWLFDSIAKADPKKASKLRKFLELIDGEDSNDNWD